MQRTNIIESSRGEFHSKEIRLSQISLVIVAGIYLRSLLQVFTYGHCCRDLPTVIVVGIYLRSLLQAFTYSHCCRYLPTVIVAGI